MEAIWFDNIFLSGFLIITFNPRRPFTKSTSDQPQSGYQGNQEIDVIRSPKKIQKKSQKNKKN